MEKIQSGSAVKNLKNELTQGVELAKQLQLLMNAQSSSQETLVNLLDQILHSYDRAMSVIEHGGASDGAMVAVKSGSPPLSNYTDQACRRRWTQKVVVCGETGNVTQLDDGHTWGKYGQKDILRSKYPRGYYKCTHRKGCLARKQMQRLDEDPTTFEVTYKGLHTCGRNPTIPIIHPQNEPTHENLINQSQEEPFVNIQTSLNILDTSSDIPTSNPGNDPIFPRDHLWEDYLLDFMYPTAPELNYFNYYQVSQDIDSVSKSKPPTQDADSSFDTSSGQLGLNSGFGNSSYFP